MKHFHPRYKRLPGIIIIIILLIYLLINN